jgi:hypothetical protein
MTGWSQHTDAGPPGSKPGIFPTSPVWWEIPLPDLLERTSTARGSGERSRSGARGARPGPPQDIAAAGEGRPGLGFWNGPSPGAKQRLRRRGRRCGCEGCQRLSVRVLASPAVSTRGPPDDNSRVSRLGLRIHRSDSQPARPGSPRRRCKAKKAEVPHVYSGRPVLAIRQRRH